VRGHRLGEPDRCGRVVEARGPDGEPPYLIRWDDSDHEVLFFPGTDAVVEHLSEADAPR
jgi:hypothetical protein